MKQISTLLCALFTLFMSQTATSAGLLFNVSSTGTPANLSITLCLNGNGPLSCQNYKVSALNLNISTTIPNHVYPAVGIKVNTPGYVLTGCTPIANGHCLFSANSTTSTSIAVSSTSAFFVGGAVTGLTGTVILQNNGTNSTPISTDGNFTFSTPIGEGSTYNVTVLTQPANQTCTVSNGSGTMRNANVTNVTVTCSTNAYTVGGTISGLSGTVILQNNGTNSTSISSNGSFTFSTPIADGSAYSVTVSTQPASQTCTVSNGSGIIGGANVTNVTVTCSTNTYTVGGTVSGLSGTVTLQNNSANSTSISSNSSFTFSTPVAEGSSYNVTVQTQPTEQTCTVTNGSGTIGSSNVTNVGVSCATNNTTISVSSNGTIPVNGTSGSLTVTNTGTTYTAYNVSASLPSGWTGVTQNATDCTAILPNGGTCTLTFTSTAPYVAQESITVTGDNITSPPTTALAFSMSDYLVFSVPTASTAIVVENTDAATQDSPGINWSTDNTSIPGIYQTSTSPPCDGNTDGACTSNVIVGHYATPYNDYAAGLCYEITSDNTGTVALGTWFLPAICNFNSTFGSDTGSGCSGSTPSVYTTLYSLGFLQDMSTSYWTSTECAYVNTPETSQCNGSLGQYAWTANFGGGNNAFTAPKSFTLSARCIRVMSY